MIYLAERNLFTDCSKLLWNREKSPAGLVRLLVWRLKFVALKFLAPNDTRVSVHFVSQSSLSSISFLFVCRTFPLETLPELTSELRRLPPVTARIVVVQKFWIKNDGPEQIVRSVCSLPRARHPRCEIKARQPTGPGEQARGRKRKFDSYRWAPQLIYLVLICVYRAFLTNRLIQFVFQVLAMASSVVLVEFVISIAKPGSLSVSVYRKYLLNGSNNWSFGKFGDKWTIVI